jgi:hypothetical protein
MTEAVTAVGTSVRVFVPFGQARWRESAGKGKKRARAATAKPEARLWSVTVSIPISLIP